MTAVRLAIVGTRVLVCNGEQRRALCRIRYAITALRPDMVISGGAEGIDTLAEDVARTLGYTRVEAIDETYRLGQLVSYQPTEHQWHGPGGYKERNRRIATDCTHLLRIACVQSTTGGSAWTAGEARALGRHVRSVSVCDPNTSF